MSAREARKRLYFRAFRCRQADINLSKVSRDELGRRSGIYWEYSVPLTWIFAADPLRRARKVAECLVCRQAGGLEPPEHSRALRQGRGAGWRDALNRQGIGSTALRV